MKAHVWGTKKLCCTLQLKVSPMWLSKRVISWPPWPTFVRGWSSISRRHHCSKLRIAVIVLLPKFTMSTAFRSCFVLSGFILAYFTYLLLGALVFSAIERPVEETLKSNLDSLKAEFLNLSCINATALEAFLEKVLKANKYGVSVLENGTLHTNWDLASSLFFANTMVTTVGEFHRNEVERMSVCLMLLVVWHLYV